MRLEDALHRAIILRRKVRALHSGIRVAERALGKEGGETDLDELREVQNGLFSTEGSEADLDNGSMHARRRWMGLRV
jgi:DNA primase